MSSAKHRQWDRGFGACGGMVSKCCCTIMIDVRHIKKLDQKETTRVVVKHNQRVAPIPLLAGLRVCGVL